MRSCSRFSNCEKCHGSEVRTGDLSRCDAKQKKGLTQRCRRAYLVELLYALVHVRGKIIEGERLWTQRALFHLLDARLGNV